MQFPTSPRPLSSIQLPSWPKVLPAFLPRAQKHGLASPQEPQSPVYQPTVVIWKPAELHKTSQRNIRASTSEQATPPPKTPTPRQKKPKQGVIILVCQDPQSSFILGTVVYLWGCPSSLSPCRLLKTKIHGWLLTPSAESTGGFHSSPESRARTGQKKPEEKALCSG